MPVSIYDIARVANVAPSTVSRALQDHPRVGKKTKDYIRQLAKDMGYIPNTIAKSLSKQRTNAIGMIISEISGPFMGMIVEGAEKAAADLGYEVFVGVTGNDNQRELDIIHAFQQRRVDGLVIVASHLVRRYSKRLEQSLIPIVFINEQEEWERIVTVSVDDLESAYTAVRYLNSLGHERIGYVGAGSRSKSNNYRLQGYIKALQTAGIEFDSRLVYSTAAETNLAKGETSLRQLTEAGATAIFCYNDMTAIGVMSACRKYNIRVPDQLSIIGFDDIEFAEYTVPPLTTIRQPRLLLGQRATEMLHKLLHEEAVASEILLGELVIRETTAPLA